MWELDCKEGWVLKNWCFWTVVLEKTLENPLDCKEIQPVHSEGDQPWDFFGGDDAKAETPGLWPPHAKSWLIGKDSDTGRHWGQEEKRTTEAEMAGWHHWLNGHESEWTPGVGDGQGGLVCCDSWGRKESDTTEWLNWTELIVIMHLFSILGHRQLTFNNMDLNYMDPLIFGFFSINTYYSTSQSSAGWFHRYRILYTECWLWSSIVRMAVPLIPVMFKNQLYFFV